MASLDGIPPLLLSGLLHGLMGLSFLLFFFKSPSSVEVVEMEVIEAPVPAASPLKAAPLARPQPKTNKARAVFGVSKHSLQAEDSTVAVKPGNTVAIAPDNLKLRPQDADSLPIPSEEYLVTSMPELLSEFTIPYPAEARKQKIQGPVTLDLLIDAKGAVRDASVVSGPAAILNEAALLAVKQLKFKPAFIEEKTVAVKIRYVYRFVLEH